MPIRNQVRSNDVPSRNAEYINAYPEQEYPGYGQGSEQGGSFYEPANEELEKNKGKFVIKFLDKIIGASIFMIFFGILPFFTGLTLQGLVFDKQIFFYFWLLLGLVSWAAKGVITGEMKIRRTPLDIPIAGFLLAYLIATIFSIDQWHSFWGGFGDPSRGIMNVIALAVSYYLILSNFSKARLKMIFTAILFSGILVSFWTLLAIRNIQFLPQSVSGLAPLSLTGSMTGLGILFSAMIPIIVTAILKIGERENIKKVFKIIYLGFLFLALLVNLLLISAIYNFVPWVGLFIGIAIFLIFILAKIVKPEMSWAWLPMVIFLAVMIIRMTGEVSISKIDLPWEVSPTMKTSWDIAVDSLKDKFFVGTGPGTYSYVFALNRPQDINTSIFYNLKYSQATGLIFEALPTIGILGAVLLVILILSYLGVNMYLLYREKEKNKLYSLALFSASIVMLVASISARAEGTILIFAVFLGIASLAAILLESESQENYLNLSLKTSPKFALALAFVFMVVSAGVAFLFVFLGKIYIADVYAFQAAKIASSNQEDAVMKMAKSIGYNNREGKYYAQLGQYYMMLANREALKDEKTRDTQLITQYLNASVNVTKRSQDLMKRDVLTEEALGQIYENAGLYVPDSLNLAIESYQKGLELEPQNPNYYLKIGQIKISLAAIKGSNEQEKKQLLSEAKDNLLKAVDKKSNFSPALYQLSLVYDALGEIDQAIDSGTKAVQFGKNDADFRNYVVSLGRIYQERGKDEDVKIAEQLFKAMISQNDNDINAHFYLGMLYEKTKNKDGAKEEYKKVASLLGSGNEDVKKQVEKMIANVEKGILNTPETLGLTKSTGDVAGEQTENTTETDVPGGSQEPEVPNGP
jgi:cytochrome c-type biogenesis protein CcmH/NrfG